MKTPPVWRLLALLCAGGFSLVAAHPFLCCDNNGGWVCVVSAEGTIEWECACKAPQDCWRLPNGNPVFANCLGHGQVGAQPVFS